MNVYVIPSPFHPLHPAPNLLDRAVLHAQFQLDPSVKSALQSLVKKYNLRLFGIGKTCNVQRLRVHNGKAEILNLDLPPLHKKWAGVLEEKLGL